MYKYELLGLSIYIYIILYIPFFIKFILFIFKITDIYRFKIFFKLINFFLREGRLKVLSFFNLNYLLKKNGLNLYFIILFYLKKFFIFIGIKNYKFMKKKKIKEKKKLLILDFNQIINLSLFFFYKYLLNKKNILNIFNKFKYIKKKNLIFNDNYIYNLYQINLTDKINKN